MVRRKHLSMIAMLLALCLCLGACSSDKQSSPENADILLPEPAAEAPVQILGDALARSEYDVTLHHASEDSLTLSTTARRLSVEKNEDPVQVLMSELMTSAALNGSVNAELLGVEYGGGTVTVNLSIEAGVNRSEQDYLLLCASIANTLLELKDVHAVNVLTGGRSDPLCALPMGVFTQALDNIPAAYAQVQSESERIAGDPDARISRNALLYFPAQGGRYLLAEVARLDFTADQLVSAVLDALAAGPAQDGCGFSPIPGADDLLAGEPVISVTEAGERIIELNFDSALANYLDVAGIEGWQLYGSLVLTLCSFVPETDGVRIMIGSEAVSGCIMNGAALSFEQGILRRRDFGAASGSSAELYFAAENGSLAGAVLPLGQSESRSPRRLLIALVNAAAPEGLSSVFPAGISGSDILGVRVQNRTATVNLSANFYARCQGMNAAQERRMIYAMVNTLTQLDEIGAVAFLVEGEALESLAQNIYLKTPLLPDPGLVQ